VVPYESFFLSLAEAFSTLFEEQQRSKTEPPSLPKLE